MSNEIDRQAGLASGVGSQVLRDAIQRIKFHRFVWRIKGKGADSLAFLKELQDSFAEEIAKREGTRYTVVYDWEDAYWEQTTDETPDDGPHVFHVWAPDACEASDIADEIAAERLGPLAAHLKHVAVLHGHAPLVCDGE
ncbi:hypothetical protein [Streptomyces sp. NPDC051546]|uniref:hypothetical protein n=1 Tax=Streptomyces sp. NPDC051546 TaxID=3365655 RepID=UPI00379F9B34